MREIIQSCAYFGVFLTLAAYFAGAAIRKKTGLSLFNPLMIAIVLIIALLSLFDIPYAAYQKSSTLISSLLTPATICFAVPLYEQLAPLKRNSRAILTGIVCGVLSSLLCVLALSVLFSLDHRTYVTLLPKSITSAIGLGVSEELGGYPSITVAVIIITGIIGNIFAESFCRLCRNEEPIARGVAIGCSSHAIGTAKAMEIGEIEGAMSSLSIVVCGLLTVAAAPLFAALL